MCEKSGSAVIANSRIAGKIFASYRSVTTASKKGLALLKLPLLAELAKEIHVAIKPELQKPNLA